MDSQIGYFFSDMFFDHRKNIIKCYTIINNICLVRIALYTKIPAYEGMTIQ